MTWNDIPWQPSDRMLRQFAAASLAGLIILAWRFGSLRQSDGWTIGLALLAGAVCAAALFRPQLLRGPFLALTLLTFPVGWLFTRVLLAVLFHVVFTPMGLAFRLMGRDALALRPNPDATTWWSPRETPGDPASYFRQF